jgi:hypothetical protein
MSAPLAGKFQDHYKVLAVDAKADSETISKACATGAKYHPRNAETGDRQVRRRQSWRTRFSQTLGCGLNSTSLKSGGEEKAEFNFSGLDFFTALGARRLCARLCCASLRPPAPQTIYPGLSMRRVEAMLETTSEGLNFALWYLKQRPGHQR